MADPRTANRNYPVPSNENTIEQDFTRLITLIGMLDLDVAAVLAALAGKAALEHSHAMEAVSGLAAALAAKAGLDHNHALSALSDVTATGAPVGTALVKTAGGWQAGGLDAAILQSGTIDVARLPSGIFGGLTYKGAWNASTNSPAIPTAAPANQGWYYRVSVAGSTLISGISDWGLADWIVSNGTTWDKVDNSESPLPPLVSNFAALAIVAGDLVYGLGSGTLARLGIGSAGSILRSVAGVPSWVAPATVAEYRSAADRPVTAQGAWNAAAVQSVPYAASVAIDFSQGWNVDLSALAGAFTLANPTNAKVGQAGFVKLPQDGTGGRLITYGSFWQFGGTKPALSTSANAIDYLFYQVVGGSAAVCSLVKAVV